MLAKMDLRRLSCPKTLLAKHSSAFSFYIKREGQWTYEGYARKIQDHGLKFPDGKRNKIILVGRELDDLLHHKMLEKAKQERILKDLSKLKEDDEKTREELESQIETVCANGCVLLYRSMLQMT